VTKIIRLQVISHFNVNKRIVFSTNDKDALVKGVELESHVCGCCGFILAENVMTYNYRDIILQCPNCKAYNEASKSENLIT
jgi:predicted  nucleic acid-binding Zn-ribbon protein